MMEGRLRWFGHVKRRPQTAPVRIVETLIVEGLRIRGRPKLRWEDTLKYLMKELLLSEDMTSDRNAHALFATDCAFARSAFCLFVFMFLRMSLLPRLCLRIRKEEIRVEKKGNGILHKGRERKGGNTNKSENGSKEGTHLDRATTGDRIWKESGLGSGIPSLVGAFGSKVIKCGAGSSLSTSSASREGDRGDPDFRSLLYGGRIPIICSLSGEGDKGEGPNMEDAVKAVKGVNGKVLNGRTLGASIAADNGRAAEFIKKRVYKDKTRCYECGEGGHLSYECPRNKLGTRSAAANTRRGEGWVRLGAVGL
ncbi:U11/U12 small nuclear ribonucleoprotein 31 kDa protein [Tanacetum coccineum]